jgi:hypothetical protein
MNTLPTFTVPLFRMTVTWLVARPSFVKFSVAVPLERARYGVNGRYMMKLPPSDALKLVTAWFQMLWCHTVKLS